MTLQIGRAWIDIDWDWRRRYVEVYSIGWPKVVVTLGPFGLMTGVEGTS